MALFTCHFNHLTILSRYRKGVNVFISPRCIHNLSSYASKSSVEIPSTESVLVHTKATPSCGSMYLISDQLNYRAICGLISATCTYVDKSKIKFELWVLDQEAIPADTLNVINTETENIGIGAPWICVFINHNTNRTPLTLSHIMRCGQNAELWVLCSGSQHSALMRDIIIWA